MSTESKLLKEIAKSPDDDEPRLVLADWYEETGNPRGALIRTQCEMEHLDWDDPRYVELEDVQYDLLAKHRKNWIKDLPKLTGVAWGNHESVFNESIWDDGRQFFRRGFVDSVSIRDRKSLQASLTKLKMLGVSYFSMVDTNTDASYELLKKVPNLKGLTFPRFSELELPWLAGFKQLNQVRALGVSERNIGSEETDALLELKMPALRSLDVSSNDLGSTSGMRKFLKWDGLDGLRWLDLKYNRLGGPYDDPTTQVIAALAKEKKLANLFSIHLGGNSLDDSHLEAFVRHAKMKRLVHLSLSHTRSYNGGITSNGVQHLFSGKFRQLRFLGLSTTEINNDAVKVIAESKWAKTLKRLNIGHNEKISDPGIRAVATSENLANLTHLNIPGIKLGERGAKSLIASETLNSIRQLNIGKAELLPATIKALKKRFPKAVIQKPYY